MRLNLTKKKYPYNILDIQVFLNNNQNDDVRYFHLTQRKFTENFSSNFYHAWNLPSHQIANLYKYLLCAIKRRITRPFFVTKIWM